MSDPEVPQHKQPDDVNDVVDSANAGLADAEAARGEAPATSDGTAPAPAVGPSDESPTDAELAAFEAAERDYPGTFSTPPAAETRVDDSVDATPAYSEPASAAVSEPVQDSPVVVPAAASYSTDDQTRVLPSEPVSTPQPIFVQAPEPPRNRGNRATAAGIGLVATVAFALLYLGTALGLGAINGEVTGANIGESALGTLATWGFWTPVVVFFLGFWLLGAIINRGRWGLWVVFGILVGLAAYVGHILGQLFEAPFWNLTMTEGTALVGEQLLAPLAIAAFVFGRELTIWFGAWVARIGARKTELNIEAQREYERTLEAGPTLAR